MKLDINRAWAEASAAVAANREVLLALAGVFILLPRLAFELFAPEPQTQTGMDLNAALQLLQGYYAQMAPWLLAVVLVETTGTLALFSLFTDRSRPTVGETIGRGVRSVLPYLAAQVLFAMIIGFGGALALGLADMSGYKPLVGLAMGTLLFWVLYGALRLLMLAPVVVVEKVRRPLAALARAWALTRGHTARILGFVLLFVVVMLVVMAAVSGVVGSLGAMLLDKATVRIVVAVVASVLSTLFAVYLVAMIAAVHRQLAGPSPDQLDGIFR